MDQVIEYARPEVLKLGRKYVRIERQLGQKKMLELTPVTLAGYDPCPAFVIVKDTAGIRLRCPRNEIFISPDSLTPFQS
jgi:hypothetical protein